MTIWERLESDTDKSYHAFCIYRDMGATRSLAKVAQELSKSETIINRWSGQHDWVNRVSAYDDYQLAQRQERIEKKRIELEDNVLADYLILRQAISKYISDYSAVNFKGINPHDISNLASLMKQADDYARRAVGLPDKINDKQKTELTGANGDELIIKVVYDDYNPKTS